MAKRIVYLAAKCRYGIIEAYDKEWINVGSKNTSWSLDAWKKRMRKDHPDVVFEDATASVVEKETKRYGDYWQKERAKKDRELKKEIQKIAKQSKVKSSEEEKIEEEPKKKSPKKSRKKRAVKSVSRKSTRGSKSGASGKGAKKSPSSRAKSK